MIFFIYDDNERRIQRDRSPIGCICFGSLIHDEMGRSWMLRRRTEWHRGSCVSASISRAAIATLRGTRLSPRFTGADRHGRIHTYKAGVTPTTFCAAAAAVETDHWRRAATDVEARTTTVTSRLMIEMHVIKSR